MSDWRQQLIHGLVSLGIDPVQHVLEQFELFVLELRKWCLRTRLVSNSEPENLVENHILDSLTALPYIRQETVGSIIDLGSGAGFPGVCVSIIASDLSMTLLDSRQVRTEFLKTVVRKLSLINCSVLNLRLDDRTVRDPTLYQKFNVVMARGFAPLKIILDLGLPLLEDGGRFVLHRGPASDQDIELNRQLIAQRNLVEIAQDTTRTDSRKNSKNIMVVRKT